MASLIEKLKKELQEGSGYYHSHSGEHFECENVQFVFTDDKVTIVKKYAYDFDQDQSSEWLKDEWKCTLPKKVIDDVITELAKTGKSMLSDVYIDEKCTGRMPYSVVESNDRNYTTNLELTLNQEEKPIIKINNPVEIRNANNV